jgi:hypothetical protein
VISSVLHTIALLVPGLWLGRILKLPFALRVGATFLIFEASLVIGGGLLSWAALLGHLRAYQIVTVLCAASIAGGIWWIGQLRTTEQKPTMAAIPNGPLYFSRTSARLLYAVPILGLTIFGGLIFFVALNGYPAVEDSLTIKLPKIIFAIQANSILPTDFSDDGRMYISPVYPVLLQLFFIINGLKAHGLLVFGFINWAMCGIAVYQLCEYAGAPKLPALLVTAAVLLTPTLIAQGASEGDDLMAAAPFVVGLMFLIPALVERLPVLGFLSGIGIGISFAMKFLPVFYLPALGVAFVAIVLSRGGPRWLLDRFGTVFWFLGAFIFILLPFVISNLVAYGKPFYVSEAVNSASNWPFNAECAVRASIGHIKQVMSSDMVRLTASLLSKTYEDFQSKVGVYNDFVSSILPYNPIPRCTAYGGPFVLTNWYLNENTLWFGLVGPVLVISSIIVILSPKLPPVARALGLGFLLWQLTFDFATRYYGENGRYWSMAVLAGCPAIAIVINNLMQRRWGAWLAAAFVGLSSAVIAAQGRQVLIEDNHHSLSSALARSRYINMLTPGAATLIAKASAVNVQVLYGINTYDYYMLLGPEAKLFNKQAILDDMINIVAVRPFGVADNPFGDQRIPVKMRSPFAKGFRFAGAAPGQNLSFANNFELLPGRSIDAQSLYLIFETGQLKKEEKSISGVLHPIESSKILDHVRYRVGWRATDGSITMPSEWKNGAYADFKVSDSASALVIEATFDGDAAASSSEWPMKAFLTGAGLQMLQSFNEGAKE